jgi:NCAIR mutase (PurE)-related protein
MEDFAKLDTARDIRTGFPEAIFAEGKNDQNW